MAKKKGESGDSYDLSQKREEIYDKALKKIGKSQYTKPIKFPKKTKKGK